MKFVDWLWGGKNNIKKIVCCLQKKKKKMWKLLINCQKNNLRICPSVAELNREFLQSVARWNRESCQLVMKNYVKFDIQSWRKKNHKIFQSIMREKISKFVSLLQEKKFVSHSVVWKYGKICQSDVWKLKICQLAVGKILQNSSSNSMKKNCEFSQ